MAKKTKTTAGPKPERKTTGDRTTTLGSIQASVRLIETAQAERALHRVESWVDLLDELDRILDGGNRPETIEAKCARRLAEALQLAANRIAIVDESGKQEYDLNDLRDRIVNGRSIQYHDRSPSDAVARAIRAVRRLLDADLALARKGSGRRAPADIELAVLRELLRAETVLFGEALAKRITGRPQPDGMKRPIDAKGVSDAILRLRHECGYMIPNDRKTGYRVDDGDRDLARYHGVSVGTDGVQSE